MVKVDMCRTVHDLPTVVAFDLGGEKPVISILRHKNGKLLIVSDVTTTNFAHVPHITIFILEHCTGVL